MGTRAKSKVKAESIKRAIVITRRMKKYKTTLEFLVDEFEKSDPRLSAALEEALSVVEKINTNKLNILLEKHQPKEKHV